MSVFLSRMFRFAAQKIVFSPQARRAAVKAAHGAIGEARLIARDQDRARAAGRSIRRALNKLQGGRDAS